MSSINLNDAAPPAPSYHVPALEKGLDILECLAAQGVPLTQAQIARAIGRSANELFRMLTTLERRGYIQRDPLTGAIRESCHLSVIEREHLVVLVQEESPTRVRLSVEIGGAFPLLHTVSGRVLLAYLDEPARADLLAREGELARLPAAEQIALHERLRLIRMRGYDTSLSETTDGVSDLAVLVGTATSRVQAALTVASLTRQRATFVDDTLPALKRCAEAIGQSAG